jgi:hypothetical protein
MKYNEGRNIQIEKKEKRKKKKRIYNCLFVMVKGKVIMMLGKWGGVKKEFGITDIYYSVIDRTNGPEGLSTFTRSLSNFLSTSRACNRSTCKCINTILVNIMK